jgi:hypothetical protein
METKLKLFIILLLFSTISIIPAYAVEVDIEDIDIEGIAKDLIGSGIDGVYDEVISEVDIPRNDYINPTDEEMENLKNDSKEWVETLVELLGVTHNVAESSVHAVSDYDLDPWITTLIGIGVVALVAIPMMKKLGMDMLKIVLISIGFVIVFAVVGLVF